MRKRHVCPKCQHNHILLIESVADLGEGGYSAPAHIALAFAGDGWLGDKTKAVGKLSAALCRQCGYTELYTPEMERASEGWRAGPEMERASEGWRAGPEMERASGRWRAGPDVALIPVDGKYIREVVGPEQSVTPYR